MARLAWSIDCKSRYGFACIAQTERPTRELALEHFREHYEDLQLDTLRSADLDKVRPTGALEEYDPIGELERRMLDDEANSPYEPGSFRRK